jgi:hypothetical protein
MAGINELVKGAVGTFAKDKVSPMLSPSQMDFITFALNPQAYLLNKGVTAAADYLGYGNDYRELKAGADDEKEYYKEILRNTVGDVLPGSIGDFVRATPKMTDDAYEASMEALRQSASTPEATARFENTVRDMNYGTQTPGQGKYVGPLPEDNPMFGANVSNLPYELKSTPVSGAPDDFDPALLASIIRGDDVNTPDIPEIAVSGTRSVSPQTSTTDDFGSPGYTYDPNLGMNVPATESLAPVGYTFDDMGGVNIPAESMPWESDYGNIGGGKLEDYSYSQYKRGGQVCGCKH